MVHLHPKRKEKYGRITTRIFYYNIKKKQEQNNPCVKQK